MEQPSIYPFGIRIDEPVTMLTDVLVAVICIIAAFKLRKYSDGSGTHKIIISYFAMMGVATFIGGVIGHGFLYALGFYWKLPGWLLSMLAVNFLERVMIRYSKPILSSNGHKFFTWFNVVELLTFMALSFATLNFLYVEIHSTYGFLVVVFGFCIFNYRRRNRTKAVKLMMIAVGMIFICSVIFVGKISISKWFNHADFAHIFMAIGAVFFYYASKEMMLETQNGKDLKQAESLLKEEGADVRSQRIQHV